MGIKSNRLRRTAPWLFMLCGPVALQTGCGSQGGGLDTTNSSDLALTIVGGVTLNEVDYTIITSDRRLYRGGQLIVSHSTGIATVISGLAAATGYQILLTATDVDNPSIVCTGFAVFDIVARTTSPLHVNLSCHEPDTTGGVAINGSVNICPLNGGLSVAPSSVLVGYDTLFVLTARDADSGPNALTYTWSSSGGSLGASTQFSAVFTCTEPGIFSVSVTISDGFPGCDSSATQYVSCAPADSVGDATGASPFCGDGVLEKEVGEQCDDGNLASGDGCSTTCQIDDNLDTPGDDRAGYIACGNVSCGPGTDCCSSSINLCTPSAGGCNMPGQVPCDGPEDCADGQQCFSAGHGNGCAVVFPTGSMSVYCHTDADCRGTANPCQGGRCHS